MPVLRPTSLPLPRPQPQQPVLSELELLLRDLEPATPGDVSSLRKPTIPPGKQDAPKAPPPYLPTPAQVPTDKPQLGSGECCAETNVRLAKIERLIGLSMIMQDGAPVTSLGAPFYGDAIGTTNSYLPLYRNVSKREVRVQVIADWGNPGVGVKLSTTPGLSDEGKVDTLSNTANGKSESVGIILRPQATLYINSFDTNFALDATDVFRVKVTDLADLLNE